MIFLALAVGLSACSGYSRHRDGPPPSEAPVTYGSGTKLPDGIKTALGNKGTIDLIVTDNQRRALPGAIVRYKGAKTGKATTNERGQVRFDVAPGKYLVEVIPCGTTVITDTYASADVVVNVGRIVAGALTDVKWHRRFTPRDSAETSKEPPWKRNVDVTIGVRVEDGCTFAPAPGASLAGYGWTVSPNFRISRTPVLRADARGFARVTVRCVSSGNGSIVIANRSDRSDRVDALTAASGPPAGKNWCA